MDVYIECGECIDFGTENFEEMVKHILNSHTGYSPEEAYEHAALWQEEARERQDVDNIYRGTYYDQFGYDPNEPPSDKDPL